MSYEKDWTTWAGDNPQEAEAELLAELRKRDDAKREALEDAEGRDLVEAIHERKAFDHMAPLPDLHIRQSRSWEPAARRYRDLTEEEKEMNA